MTSADIVYSNQPSAADVSHGEAALTSPPAENYDEPDVPDPFLVDSDDAEDSSGDDLPLKSPHLNKRISQMEPSHEISLSQNNSAPPTATSIQFVVTSPNRDKDVPPPPSVDSDPDEEEAPEIYLPGLVVPTMFLPLPSTDPLSTLLNKYVPAEKRPFRDISGEWQRTDFHTLVLTSSWRALARMARDRLVASDPEDLTLVLGLWYLRLSCLARLRLFNQTSAECTNLFTVLESIESPVAKLWLFERVLPFELEVMQTRLKYWAGDHMGYLDALSALLRKCRTKARQGKEDQSVVSMWKERGARICLIIASQLLEMKDHIAAAMILEPLCSQGPDLTSPEIRSAIGRIYLQVGNLHLASQHFAQVNEDPSAEQNLKDLNAALLAAAEGNWDRSTATLRDMANRDSENFAVLNDLAVTLLCNGKLKEGIEVLETALRSSPSSVVAAEPFLFNLSTLYELRSAAALEKKKDLLIEVAKWSGDGLKTACLKMPTT